MKTVIRLLVLSFALTCALGMVAEAAKTVKMNRTVDNFTLKDASGKKHSLTNLSKDTKATVVMFIATQCPVSNDYNERMVKLYNDYKDKGVQFIGINANKQESVKEIAEHSGKHGFEFAMLKDPQNKIADYFGARRTPEVYLLDADMALRYHGAIDNSQESPDKHYLRQTLDLVVAGQEVPKDLREMKAFGCSIKRVKAKNTRKRTP